MFGQVVIGPPGSGKTTYCKGLKDFLTHLGRKVAVVNLDPANDHIPYECSVNIADLITLEDVMDSLELGPNGGLLYCLEYLEKNIDWLRKSLENFKDHYILFDCPGQVELYTHHSSVRNIFSQLTKWNYRLVAVHLVDSHYCNDASKFISVLLTSLATMLQVELPHINVLSKTDLIEKYGKLKYNLDFYTDVLDLGHLTEDLKGIPFFAKFAKLNDALCGIIEDYSLVSFIALDIQDNESILRVVRSADKANGYVFGEGEERNLGNLLSYAVQAEFEYEKIAKISEKFMDTGDQELTEDEMMKLWNST